MSYCIRLQYIFSIHPVDVIKHQLNLTWWNNSRARAFSPYTCTSRSCSLYSWWTVKSILGVSVALTSASHLFVKDLAPFKSLFPFIRPVLYGKLSCHWWHQMTSIIVYGLRSNHGLYYMVAGRTALSYPGSEHGSCSMTFIHTFNEWTYWGKKCFDV